MPRLEISSQGQTQVVAFRKPQLSIGRQEGNDIVITDSKASRRHCILELSNGNIQLRDLDSHNGTWVGENRIIETSLHIGDMLRIGDTFIRVLPDEGKVFDVNVDAIVEPEVVVEEEEEQSAPSPAKRFQPSAKPAIPARNVRPAATKGAAATIAGGPLAKQLASLMQACQDVPEPPDAPQSPRDIRLLNRKSEPVANNEPGATKSAEALDMLRQLLFVAFRTRATDIHIEPKADVYAIRFRVDGLLHAVGEITSKIGLTVLNVIKILCDMDIAKRSVVQEGNFAVELLTRRVDFRVNMTPSVHGQKLALRFLDKGAVPSQFENLGMDFDAVSELARICEQDAGMIIIAGPTGSGKSTTLYTALQTLDAHSRHIVTIEDPVEYEMANTTQISIDPLHNLTFASVLSSVLRQDPDVILVGEIRDDETARMAMQAATTGHLVLTTIHARDTVGTVFRLLDLGVEAFLVANALTMCISQRLVRVLCPDCKRPYKPESNLIRRMKLEGRPFGLFYEPVGCKRCMNTGYRGRMALFEILRFTPQVRDVVLGGPTIADLRKAAGEWMFHTLLDSGYKKVIEGVTTVQEVERVSSTG
jgi:general secretion pathway protein E